MTRLIYIFFVLLTTVLTAYSQEKQLTWDQKKQQFKTEKVAFISTAMNFTVDQAQKFWPIYNKYDKIFDEIGEERHQTFDPRTSDVNSLSSAQCDYVLTTFISLDDKELQAKKCLLADLKSVFPSDFVMKYYHAEHEFRRKIFQNNKTQGASFGKSYKSN